MKVAPDAALDDGWFDVVTLGDFGFGDLLVPRPRHLQRQAPQEPEGHRAPRAPGRSHARRRRRRGAARRRRRSARPPAGDVRVARRRFASQSQGVSEPAERASVSKKKRGEGDVIDLNQRKKDKREPRPPRRPPGAARQGGRHARSPARCSFSELRGLRHLAAHLVRGGAAARRRPPSDDAQAGGLRLHHGPVRQRRRLLLDRAVPRALRPPAARRRDPDLPPARLVSGDHLHACSPGRCAGSTIASAPASPSWRPSSTSPARWSCRTSSRGTSRSRRRGCARSSRSPT